MMTDLTGFLLARLADDEAAARAAVVITSSAIGEFTDWYTDGESIYLAGLGAAVAVGPYGSGIGAATDHIARHDPTRVLADCAARRAVVDALVDMRALLGKAVAVGRNPTHMRVAVESYEHVVRCLAAVYDSHPDYDERWRP
jgi:hypothetical protein